MVEGGPRRLLNCKKRTCPYCGNLWAGDVKVMLLQNLNDGFGRAVDMVTITAPGREVLPHERDASGQWLVSPDAAEAWNLSAPVQWSKMWGVAKYLLRRRGNDAPRLLAYVIAYQRRGVIHYHLALAADTPRAKKANSDFVALLKGEAWAIRMYGARAGTLERKTVHPAGARLRVGLWVRVARGCPLRVGGGGRVLLQVRSEGRRERSA